MDDIVFSAPPSRDGATPIKSPTARVPTCTLYKMRPLAKTRVPTCRGALRANAPLQRDGATPKNLTKPGAKGLGIVLRDSRAHFHHPNGTMRSLVDVQISTNLRTHMAEELILLHRLEKRRNLSRDLLLLEQRKGVSFEGALGF